LPADNLETFPLKELTVRQGIIARKGYEAVPVKRENIMAQIKARPAFV